MNKPEKLVIMTLACIILSIAAAAVVNAQENPYSDYNNVPGWSLLGFTGLFCIIPLIAFIIAIVLAIWVYKDAEKRGSSGALWLIIVLLTGIIGLIIWLVVRPPIGGKKPEAASSERRCPNCGRVIPQDARTCPYCGKNFET